MVLVLYYLIAGEPTRQKQVTEKHFTQSELELIFSDSLRKESIDKKQFIGMERQRLESKYL